MRSFSQEQRLHARLRRNKLVFPCKLTHVSVPVKKATEDTDAVMAIEDWPVLLPKDLAQALIGSGKLGSLIGDRAERLQYWEKILQDFPAMNLDPMKTAPLAVYGDEATVFRTSCMALHWAPSLCPDKTNSLRSRFLCCVIPSNKYWIEHWPVQDIFAFGWGYGGKMLQAFVLQMGFVANQGTWCKQNLASNIATLGAVLE